MNITEFAIVIKTDSYAGNFEREMCAHVTGHVGECGVGSEYVNSEVKSKFYGYIEEVPDDRGCYRPVSLGCDLPDEFGLSSDDVVIWFNEKPTDEMVKVVNERLETFKHDGNSPQIYEVFVIKSLVNISFEKM